MNPEKALRAYFAVLALIAITLVVVAVLAARGGASHQRNIDDLTHAIWCDRQGLSPAACELSK